MVILFNVGEEYRKTCDVSITHEIVGSSPTADTKI